MELCERITSRSDFEEFCKKAGGELEVTIDSEHFFGIRCRFDNPNYGAYDISVGKDDVLLLNNNPPEEHYILEFPHQRIEKVEIWYGGNLARAYKPKYVEGFAEGKLKSIELIYYKDTPNSIGINLNFKE